MALERLAQAKALLGLLARGVRDVIRPPEEEGFAPERQAASIASEPTTTREREPAFPGPSASVAVPPRVALITPPPPRPADPALLEAALLDLKGARSEGLSIVCDASHVAIAWRAPSGRLAAARALSDGPLALRMVAVCANGDEDVAVDTLELGPAQDEGSCVIVRPASMLRAVASVGVASGSRFMSVAHADAA